jgi:hypothetical protein
MEARFAQTQREADAREAERLQQFENRFAKLEESVASSVGSLTRMMESQQEAQKKSYDNLYNLISKIAGGSAGVQ